MISFVERSDNGLVNGDDLMASLADFGAAPEWIATWCLFRKDLDGFAIHVRQSEAPPPGPTLTVYLYRDEWKASRTFGLADVTVGRHIVAELNRLIALYPHEESTS